MSDTPALNYPLSRLVQTDVNVYSVYLIDNVFGDPSAGFAVVESIVAFILVEPGADNTPRLRLRVNARFQDAFQNFVFDDEGEAQELYLKVLQRLQAVAEGKALLAKAPALITAETPVGGQG